MRIEKPTATIIFPISGDMSMKQAGEDMVSKLANAARTCYRSESKGFESDKKLVNNLIKNGHHAMLEHASFTVKFICDRGVSHELVRHRLASFAQESTRYCNYGHEGEISVIEPIIFSELLDDKKESLISNFLCGNGKLSDLEMSYISWYTSCQVAESSYLSMIKRGCSPEIARSVLPNSLKTEIVMTANLREWRHFFELRAVGLTGKPHPEMVRIARPLLLEISDLIPIVFDDLCLLI